MSGVTSYHQCEQLRRVLESRFGSGGKLVCVRAPGRVNLIGEHTDYNDGFVLPMALQQEVLLCGRKRTDRLVRLWAENFSAGAQFALDELSPGLSPTWARYPAGVVWSLGETGVASPGFDAVVSGDLPVGAGLSSSAAIEVAFALLITRLADTEVERKQLALLCQRAENEFVGVGCGIMDQFVSLLATEGRALFLDCRSLDYELVPMDTARASIVVIDSSVKHELGATAYHQRQEECRQAVAEISQHLGAKEALRDVSLQEFERVAERLSPILRRRTRHVITENERVLESIEALRVDNVQRFGELMNASHESLRHDYEVSCRELDLLVGFAHEVPGCLGARMTGGGFGGAMVVLTEKGAAEKLAQEVTARYQETTGLKARAFFSSPAAAASVLRSDAQND